MRRPLTIAALLFAGTSAFAQMSVADTRAIVEPYVASHDPRYLTEDAVFVHMATGEEHAGREAVGRMLDYVYHQAFDAHAEDPTLIVGEGAATLEATFVGRHVGTFAGIEATGRDVRIPLAVSYTVTPAGISHARVYMLMNVMFAQLGAHPPAASE